MAEIRCPMCSKSNPEDLDVCNFCGARMKPLIVDPTSPEAPTDWGDDLRAEPDEGSDEAEDWLARVRDDVDRMEQAPTEEPKVAAEPTDDPDWLGRLRHVEVDRDLGAPVGEIPEWLEEATEDQIDEEVTEEELEQEIPDWLARIRDRESDEAVDEYQPSLEPDEAVDTYAPQLEPDEAVDTYKPQLEPDEAVDTYEPQLEPDEAVDTYQPSLEPDEDWLERIREDDAPAPSEEVEAPVGLDADDRIEPALDIVPPEILATFDAPVEHVEEIEPDLDAILSEAEALEKDWFIEDEVVPPESEEPAVTFEAEITEEEPPAEVEPPPIPLDALPEEEPSPPEPSDSIPSWAPPDYEESRPQEIDAEEVPEWLKDTGPLVESDLPRMPALVLDEEEEPSETVEKVDEPVDLDLDAIELPDWLTDLRETKAREEIEQDRPADELAPASLPNWLEAMRPIETFRSIVEIESEEDKAVESAGPLAGLRGVLAAEPVMAMPRAAGVGITRLDVTERQYAQTEILQRIVQEDEGERPAQVRIRVRRPIARWLVTLFLVLAVALPSLMPGSMSGVFPLPSLVPRDLGPLFSMVERLPTEEPVLVVFDYTPGYYGELEAVAGVFLEHVMSRDLFVATVSTSPTGPPLAEEMLSRFGENGADYINLGYLSGGPTAVQLFAAAPREAVREGFNLPDELEGTSGWHSPYLAGAARLDDFGMVAVITAGTESARTWAEQAYPWKGGTPLIMVLSTGAEPFVRPYYEALNPQVDGILTGLPSAVAYEQQIARVSTARSRWDAFGFGAMAAEFILIAGGLYGAALWWLRFRRVQG